MRKILFILLLMPLLLVSCLGNKELKTSVEDQANDVGRLFLKANFNAYLDRMAPFVYANQAEREQLKKLLQEQRDQLYARDHSEIKNIKAHLVTEIEEHDDYYQCVLKQEVLIKNDLTSYVAAYFWLAVSEDGEEWKFADITHYSEDMLRAVFPELDPKLKTDRIKKENVD